MLVNFIYLLHMCKKKKSTSSSPGNSAIENVLLLLLLLLLLLQWGQINKLKRTHPAVKCNLYITDMYVGLGMVDHTLPE